MKQVEYEVLNSQILVKVNDYKVQQVSFLF